MSKHPILESSGGMVATVSRRIVRPLLGVLLLLGAASLRAQTAHPAAQAGQLIVQNNRDVPVTVFLDDNPIDRRLGTVGPLQIATFPISTEAMHAESLRLFLDPQGELPLAARADVSGKTTRFGLVIPPQPGHEQWTTERLAAGLTVDGKPMAWLGARAGGTSRSSRGDTGEEQND